MGQARHEETPEDRQEALRRLLGWYLSTADAAARVVDSPLRHLEPCPEPVQGAGAHRQVHEFGDNAEAVRWFEAEGGNLVAVAEAAVSAEMDAIAWRLPVVSRHVHVYRAPMSEWIAATLLGLGAARREGERAAEADLSESLGMAYVQSHRREEALSHHRHALRLRREDGDELGEAMSLNSLGLVHLREHRVEEARDHFEQALTITRRLGDRRWEEIAVGNLADALLDAGEPREAVALAEEAIGIHRETGNRMSEFACLACSGAAWRELDRSDRALACARRALEVARELDNPGREGFALLELGKIQTRLGDFGEALVAYHEASSLHRRIGDHIREAEAVKFYRQAAQGYRKHRERWRLAACSDRSASAVADTGDIEAAREQWREALVALESFTDPRAERLREEIEARIGDATDT